MAMQQEDVLFVDDLEVSTDKLNRSITTAEKLGAIASPGSERDYRTLRSTKGGQVNVSRAARYHGDGGEVSTSVELVEPTAEGSTSSYSWGVKTVDGKNPKLLDSQGYVADWDAAKSVSIARLPKGKNDWNNDSPFTIKLNGAKAERAADILNGRAAREVKASTGAHVTEQLESVEDVE